MGMVLSGGVPAAFLAAALLAPVTTAHEQGAHVVERSPDQAHVGVTIREVCRVMAPELQAGFLANGIEGAPACPGRGGVIIHQPELNRFILRDSAKAWVSGSERTVSYSVEAAYSVDERGLPVWDRIGFRREGR